MGILKVWAPDAERVEVKIRENRLDMRRSGRGWWMVESPLAADGADYAFIVDGKEPLPDPRSPWQPQGVHGPSRILDHGKFPWTDSQWQPPPLSSAIIYELHVGTFTPEGTFAGVSKKLDYLKDLGITHVELMPVNTFSGSRGWGYDGVDLFAPHEVYGGPEGLKTLVNACHEKGLAVILDVVYNHLGPSGNYLGRFGPYFTRRYATPWGEAVNLDGPRSDEVRRFFIDNALMWLRVYHMDALRIPALRDGRMERTTVQYDEEARRLIMKRGAVLVVCNLAEVGQRIPCSDLGGRKIVLASEPGIFPEAEEIWMPAHSVAIFAGK